MQELTLEQTNEVNGGSDGAMACDLAVGGLALGGSLNSAVAGYVGAMAFGGPVGWAIGLGTAGIYGGIVLFAAVSCK